MFKHLLPGIEAMHDPKKTTQQMMIIIMYVETFDFMFPFGHDIVTIHSGYN
jgi:hypothetical protein